MGTVPRRRESDARRYSPRFAGLLDRIRHVAGCQQWMQEAGQFRLLLLFAMPVCPVAREGP
jgi:hypothetical protein